MAFITGTASTITDLLTAVQSALTANGYTLSGQVLNKGSLYVRLNVNGNTIELRGGTGSDGSNNLIGVGPQFARIGGSTAVGGVLALVYPVTYHIHILTAPDEVYVLINHSAIYWQWLAFGQSPAPGLPGTGNWYSAAFAETMSGARTRVVISPTSASGFDGNAATSGAFFGQNAGWINMTCCNSFIHNGINPAYDGWNTPTPLSASESGGPYGCDAWDYVQPLLGRLPNVWNGQTALLPVTVVIHHPSSKYSVVGEIKHCRYMRIDNYTEMDTITLGSDVYRVYPFLSKNVAERNGGAVAHSGTMGWAIRYDGP